MGSTIKRINYESHINVPCVVYWNDLKPHVTARTTEQLLVWAYKWVWKSVWSAPAIYQGLTYTLFHVTKNFCPCNC